MTGKPSLYRSQSPRGFGGPNLFPVWVVILVAACGPVSERSDDTARTHQSASLRASTCSRSSEQEFRCLIAYSLPAYRVVVYGDSTGSRDSLTVESGAVGHGDRQRFILEEFEPATGRDDALRFVDLDADGYSDLMVGKSWGATGNRDYGIWMFDPVGGQFVVDTSLVSAPFVDVVSGRPCILTSWNTSAYEDSQAVMCRHGGRWTTDSLVEHTYIPRSRMRTETIKARRGDSLVIVRRRSEPDTT